MKRVKSIPYHLPIYTTTSAACILNRHSQSPKETRYFYLSSPFQGVARGNCSRKTTSQNRQHQEADMFYANGEDNLDVNDIADFLPDEFDLGVDDDVLTMESQFEEFIHSSGNKESKILPEPVASSWIHQF
ncbi:hypothetical protein Nepgr_022027 [Nepenthes gracilis]|uniref:Uncharacterized protein n=1 Tax=Nepenthes gracilis TaxID=150966 RepID=A0AAD3SZY5_NEPGR|nr:hypothetical protein Nepgr_022027 [Nepenthes gracilis]